MGSGYQMENFLIQNLPQSPKNKITHKTQHSTTKNFEPNRALIKAGKQVQTGWLAPLALDIRREIIDWIKLL